MEAIELIVTSPAFKQEGDIPIKYTCDGEGINPPLQIENLPNETVTLAIIVEDPDAPNGIFDHWLVWSIDPVPTIAENRIIGINGKNSAGKNGYSGPCPPNGVHRYMFFVFALDSDIDLPTGGSRARPAGDA